MPYRRVISAILLVSGLLWLTGCAGHEGLRAGMYRSVTTPSSPVVERTVVSVPTLPPEGDPQSLDYQVGFGDQLSVTVYGRPELSTGIRPTRIDGSGNIQLPLIGVVKVVGLTTLEIRNRVESMLLKYIQIPSVVVDVTEYKSRPLYLLGDFRMPGLYYMDRPMNFIQGIALGRGFELKANIRGIRLLRDQKIVPIDLYELIQEGKIEGNFWLKPGDSIFIPNDSNLNVFVFGAVNKPGIISMMYGQLNLTQALAIAATKNNGDDLKNIRIIRSNSTTKGELLIVDAEKILRGEALQFDLKEGDVVYVPTTRSGTWNNVVKDILPSLQALSNVLTPFVMLKYLQD